MCYALVDERLAAKGLAATDDNRERLARAVSLELQRIVQEHQAYLLGKTEVRSRGSAPLTFKAAVAPLTFETVIQGWMLERKPNKKTEYVWRRVMNELSNFVGHDGVRRVSADGSRVVESRSTREGARGPNHPRQQTRLQCEQFFNGLPITGNSMSIRCAHQHRSEGASVRKKARIQRGRG